MGFSIFTISEKLEMMTPRNEAAATTFNPRAIVVFQDAKSITKSTCFFFTPSSRPNCQFPDASTQYTTVAVPVKLKIQSN